MYKLNLLIIVTLSFLGCAESKLPEEEGGQTQASCVDQDNDGFDQKSSNCLVGTDCNDASAETNPSAKEVCGDKQDNNCDGRIDEDCDPSNNCIDSDGDRFGIGEGCFGEDCDDNNSDINPRAKDICGNSIKENCTEDLPCAANCIDLDKDGYGAQGSTDCGKPEIDCDDNDENVFPGAKEICNGKDDNCNAKNGDTGIDECPGEGQTCVNDRCVGGVGSQCQNKDDCAGSNVRCDPAQSPKECRATEGGTCTDNESCLEGLTCDANKKCAGNFCDANTCSGIYNICDDISSACVQCDYTNRLNGDTQCAGDICSNGGWCGEESELPFSDWDDLRTINIDLALCWLETGDNKEICWIYSSDNSTNKITELMAYRAWNDGDYEPFFDAEEIEALDDIWGKGVFDLQDIEWRQDLTPNMNRNICMWYDPGTTLKARSMVLDLCENFSP